MLRINLLPASVNQRRLTKRLIAAAFLALIPCVVLPLLYGLKLAHDLTDVQRQADDAVAGKLKTDNFKTEAANTRAQVAPIAAKVKFVYDVRQYHQALVRVYYTLAQYTDSKIIYSDATYSGSTMTVHAYAPSIAEVGRYLQRMYQSIQADTDLLAKNPAAPKPVFSNVSIDHVPGYPEGYVNKYYLGNTLVAVGTPPAGTNLPGAATNGQNANQNTNASGSNGPGNSGSGTNQNGQNPALAFAEGITPIETILQRQMNPFAVPRQRAAFARDLYSKVRLKRAVQGFSFTVTLTMANPPVAPTVPGGTASPTAGGPGAGGG